VAPLLQTTRYIFAGRVKFGAIKGWEDQPLKSTPHAMGVAVRARQFPERLFGPEVLQVGAVEVYSAQLSSKDPVAIVWNWYVPALGLTSKLNQVIF
jgi:hypothetical protein